MSRPSEFTRRDDVTADRPQDKIGSVNKRHAGAGDSVEPCGVTVVVVGHNSARHIASLKESLASSSVIPDRLLLIDNASADDTATQAQLAGLDVHEMNSNDGFGAGCNEGLRLASTEFVLFCNPDVRPSPDSISKLRTALADTDTAAIAGAALDHPVHARRFSLVSGNFWSFLPGWLQRRAQCLERNVPVGRDAAPIVVDYAIGAFILCRVSALRAVGGFDEKFFLYCEEEDLSRRLKKAGWQTLLVPAAVVPHAHTTSSEGVDRAVMAPFRFHSLYWYYRKYHSRKYAEFARCLLSVCVIVDRAYRAITRHEQAYGPRTAIAAFRTTAAIRSDYARRTVRPPA